MSINCAQYLSPSLDDTSVLAIIALPFCVYCYWLGFHEAILFWWPCICFYESLLYINIDLSETTGAPRYISRMALRLFSGG